MDDRIQIGDTQAAQDNVAVSASLSPTTSDPAEPEAVEDSVERSEGDIRFGLTPLMASVRDELDWCCL